MISLINFYLLQRLTVGSSTMTKNLFLNTITISICLHTTIHIQYSTVSYTHLDVYKRQALTVQQEMRRPIIEILTKYQLKFQTVSPT